uniref:Uncharacterized protein n=1 Tax=Aegilops tauschii subsp. strangulata TaxID=200361 RepID=A0A453EHW5_AEGTS
MSSSSPSPSPAEQAMRMCTRRYTHSHCVALLNRRIEITNGLPSICSAQWMPELRRYAPGIPVLLVGTKLDLREDRAYLADHAADSIITTEQGEELRRQIGAVAYIECSSKTQR